MAPYKHGKGVPVPLTKELRAGKYKWCGCGNTKKVPFCDGNCKGGKPVRFEIEKKSTVVLCTCGATKHPPFCDGSHEKCAGKQGKKADAGKGKDAKGGKKQK
jgi:CDGSH-type Zn-finger protein